MFKSCLNGCNSNCRGCQVDGTADMLPVPKYLRDGILAEKPICHLLSVPQIRNMEKHTPYLRHGGGLGGYLFCQHFVPNRKCDKLNCTLTCRMDIFYTFTA
jgi:hypothetical protein